MLKSKYPHAKVLPKRFHLNGNFLRLCLRSQKLQYLKSADTKGLLHEWISNLAETFLIRTPSEWNRTSCRVEVFITGILSLRHQKGKCFWNTSNNEFSLFSQRMRQPFILVLTFVSVDKISVIILLVLNKIKFWQYKNEITEFSSIVFKAGRRGKFMLAYNKTVLFRVVSWSWHLKTFELWSK